MIRPQGRRRAGTHRARWLIAAAAALALACGGPTVDSAPEPTPTTALTWVPSPVILPASSPTPALPPPLEPAPWSPPPASIGGPPPPVSAAAAIVVDEASGAPLYEKDADRRLAPASLTKLATAVLALEAGNLDDVVATDVDSRAMRNSTVMGLIAGDRFTLRDLLYGMMLPSGNDAALAIGRHLAGSDAAFVARMNELADRIGLRDTHFANPHGLGAREHLTTARDLARLARYAMHQPGFRELVGAASWTARGSRTLQLHNINPFLFSYPGADGLKTGYTRRAGATMAASATRDGHRVYVVLLNAPARESDTQALMDWAFASFAWPPAGVVAR
jgi:D-alanyl-D-alanine carboxypeptidase